MAPPKQPYKIQKIPVWKSISKLSVGDSCIVGPCTSSQISSVTFRLPGKYQQQKVIVIEPTSVACLEMFFVHRIK